MQEYGDLGRLIKSGEYYVPEPPDITDYDLVTDPYGLNRATYLEQQKLHVKHWEYMHNSIKMAVLEPRKYGRSQEEH